ncbi:MAG: anthranilate synthase component 2 [Cyclobacteriaceae bacterium]|jgi:anthranilate synthase component 2
MDIYRNDKIELSAVDQYSDILLSPGPGLPSSAGIMPELISKYGSTKNILGVCLGHQAIGEAYGGTLFNLPIVYHGVTTEIETNGNDRLFNSIPERFTVCRYHSWVVSPEALPSDLEVLSTDDQGRIMAVKHKKYSVRGVQFHPESIMTEYGTKMISNWLDTSL